MRRPRTEARRRRQDQAQKGLTPRGPLQKRCLSNNRRSDLSYERIAEKAGVARSTVAEAIKALEFAGVLTWQNRITRVRERCADLFGRDGWRWRVIRTSNAYVFRDPKAAETAGVPSKSDQRTGTPDQDVLNLVPARPIDPDSPLQRALARLSEVIAAKDGIEQGAGG
jgi:hypothetical protein